MDLQKRKKTYFVNNAGYQKRRKQLCLEAGMTGFLCTCNFREKDCVRDAYKILDEYADKIDQPEEQKDDASPEEGEDEEDISTALKNEIKDLKAEYDKPVAARRFQEADTGVKNVIFIKTTLPNPLELVTKIITELDRTKQQRTRFILRFLPIQVVCKAYMNDIILKADAAFEKYFSLKPKTFSIVFNRHSNNSIRRDEIIEELAAIINKKNPGNKADLKNPEIAVVVEVIRGLCLISIAPDYFKFKKYNLLEICNVKERKEDSKVQPEASSDEINQVEQVEQTEDSECRVDDDSKKCSQEEPISEENEEKDSGT